MSSELAKADVPLEDMPITFNTLRMLSKGPTVPTRYQNKPNDMLAAVLVGRELGIPPMEAINSLFLVNGSVSMSGKLMSSLVHRAGHQLNVEIEKERSVVTAYRRQPDGELMEVGSTSFGAKEAMLAGLTDKETYLSYPTIMWSWRAISQACRFYFADVLSGVVYVPEEVNTDAPTEALPMDEMVVDINSTEADTLELEQSTAIIAEVLDGDVVA